MNLFHEAKKVLDKDGKVNPLGPYGKAKLTGREISAYFRRNPVKDATIRKAVSVALDLEGAMSVAAKEIKKFYGDKVLKSKEVQTALKYANEETIREDLSEGMKLAQIVRKHKSALMKAKRSGNLELPQKVETDLVNWAMDSGEIRGDDEDEFIDWLDNHIDDLVPTLKIKESAVEQVHENYRQLAQKGMGTETKKSARVGLELDYYDSKGNKQFGKITKMSGTGYTVQDDKTRKSHSFKFLDRAKAKKLLAASNEFDKNPLKGFPYNESLDEAKSFKQLYKGAPRTSQLLKDVQEMNKRGKSFKSKEGPYGGINDVTIRFSAPPTGKVIEPDPRFKSIYPNGQIETDPKLGVKHATEMLKIAQRLCSKEPYKSAFPKPSMIKDPIQIYIGHQYSSGYDKNPKYKVDITPILEEIAKISHQKMPMADARIKDLSGFYGGNVNESLQEVTKQEVNAVKKLSKDAEKMKKDYFKIAKMGDKELNDGQYNSYYESILKMQQKVLSLIGVLNNKMRMESTNLMDTYRLIGEQRVEFLEEDKVLKFTNIKDRTLEKHLKAVTKKVGAKLEKISGGFAVSDTDMRGFTAVVDYIFDKSIKKNMLDGGGMSDVTMHNEDVDPKKERLKRRREQIKQKIARERDAAKALSDKIKRAQEKGDDRAEFNFASQRMGHYYEISHLTDKLKDMKESVDLQEGTWEVPDSYPKLVALQKFLKTPHKAKTAKEVHKFHIDVDRYFGDDSFSDMLDSYYSTLPGGDIDPYDKKPMDDELLARYRKGNKIKKGTDLNLVLMKALTDWTGGTMKFKGNKIVEMPREWYDNQNPKQKSATVKATLGEKVSYVEYKFKNKNDAQKAMNMLKAVNLMSFDINDDNINGGELAVDAGKKDMTKYHKQVMQKFKPKIDVSEDIFKRGKGNIKRKRFQSIKMENLDPNPQDAYRMMWEDAARKARESGE